MLIMSSHIYYLSWPLGFSISAFVWIVLNTIWPPPGVGEVDDLDMLTDTQSDDVPEKSASDLETGFEELRR